MLLLSADLGPADVLYETSFGTSEGRLAVSIILIDAESQLDFKNFSYVQYAGNPHGMSSSHRINLIQIKNGATTIKQIHSMDNEGFISGLQSYGDWILWTDMYAGPGQSFLADIWVYNIKLKLKHAAGEKIPVGSKEAFYEVHARLDDGFVAWIHHDGAQKKTDIPIYNLESETRTTLATFAHLAKEKPWNWPVTFLQTNQRKLILDAKDSKGGYQYHIYDLESANRERSVPVPPGVRAHFGTDYYYAGGVLAFYVLKEDGEEIGIYNYERNGYLKLFPVASPDTVYKDRIDGRGPFVAFNINTVVSGMIYDHYAGYLTHLANRSTQKFPGSIELRIQGKYISDLAFDGRETTDTVNLRVFARN